MTPAAQAMLNDLIAEYQETHQFNSRKLSSIESFMPPGLWEIVQVHRTTEKVVRVNPNFSSAFCTWSTFVKTSENSRSYKKYILRLCTNSSTISAYREHIQSYYGA